MRLEGETEKLPDSMEIHFFTGKGGVGKSVLAAAQARALGQKGRKVLLVELGDQSYFQFFFGIPAVEYPPKAIRDWFDLARWSGKDCFRDYARHFIRVESLYRLFFENQVALSLIDAAPGLAEVAILGKITSGPPRNVGPSLPYDTIVVDAYSSGHFLSLLRAPAGLASAIRVGPMGEQTRSILKVLRDSSICQYHVVAQSEEMMVQETLELYASLRELLGFSPRIWMNKRHVFQESDLQSLSEGSLLREDLVRLRDQQLLADKKIEGILGGSPQPIHIPFVFETSPQLVAHQISELLERAIK